MVGSDLAVCLTHSTKAKGKIRSCYCVILPSARRCRLAISPLAHWGGILISSSTLNEVVQKTRTWSCMFNFFPLRIIENLHGRKLAAIFGEHTGITERTWRKRFKEGWSPKPEEIENFREELTRYIRGRMRSENGWSDEEVERIISREPSLEAGIGLPTAELIYWQNPFHSEDYAESIAIAIKFDIYCHSLFDAHKAGDIEKIKLILLEALTWLRSFCPADEDVKDAVELKQRFEAGVDLETLLADAKFLFEQIFLHLISCWDAEFFASYFPSVFAPYPLFELMMPRLDPQIEIERDTCRFLRNGMPPKLKIFERSIMRLFDFLSVLIYWRKFRRFPDRIPSVKDMAAWFGESEARIVSWRDETTKFTANNLLAIWKVGVGRDEQGNYPGVPLPMLVAAYLWSPLLVCEKRKPVRWVICFDGYELWWKRNLERLTAKGLKFGVTPWPKCLTDQPVGNRSPESWRSSQLSGRSSQPLDSQ